MNHTPEALAYTPIKISTVVLPNNGRNVLENGAGILPLVPVFLYTRRFSSVTWALIQFWSRRGQVFRHRRRKGLRVGDMAQVPSGQPLPSPKHEEEIRARVVGNYQR